MSDNRTIYTIQNEDGKKTTIRLDKLDVDVLQESHPDVLAWAQRAYDRVAEKKPELSRRQKRELVVLLAVKEAEKSPHYQERIDDLY